MTEAFASGRIIDVIILLMWLEAALLWLWHRRTGKGLAPRLILPILLSGMALMLAVRAALVGADWPSIAFWLLCGLFAHLLDLRQRLS